MADPGVVFLFVVIQAVVFGVAGSILAEKFRNNGSAGFLLGFLLGPIGLVMIAGITDKRPKCPECGGAIEPEFSKCRHCGSPIQWVENPRRKHRSPIEFEEVPIPERREGKEKIAELLARGVESTEELEYWLMKEGYMKGTHYTEHDLLHPSKQAGTAERRS